QHHLLLLLHLLALFPGSVADRPAPFGTTRVRMSPAWVGSWIGSFFVVHKRGNRLFRTERRELLNFGGCAAESGAVQQMCRSRVVPFASGQRLEHTPDLDVRGSTNVSL